MTLPTFLVIGTAKAGTTALYHMLAQHPAIFVSPVKEPRFFLCADGERPTFTGPGDEDYMDGIVADVVGYEALFDGVTVETAVGEMSPAYLYWPSAPARIKDVLPDVKLVAVLRDPSERAFSNHQMLARAGYEHLGFEEALAQEERRIAEGWNPSWHYAARGFYAVQLRRYLELFERDRLLLLFHEDLVAQPGESLRRLFRFLDVDPDAPIDVSRRYNESSAWRSSGLAAALNEPHAWRRRVGRLLPAAARAHAYRALTRANRTRPSIPPRARAQLVERYRSDIAELEVMARRDLAHWRR